LASAPEEPTTVHRCIVTRLRFTATLAPEQNSSADPDAFPAMNEQSTSSTLAQSVIDRQRA
jgi:hypothetical protein